MRYNNYDVSVMQLTSPQEILSVISVMKDISWVWMHPKTGLLLYKRLSCYNAGSVSKKTQLTMISLYPFQGYMHKGEIK